MAIEKKIQSGFYLMGVCMIVSIPPMLKQSKLDVATTPLDELFVHSNRQAFEPQEHTADIQSAKLH
ncbi:hypothetical protein [Photobacterium sp. Hal280]|uniref:hypothetical protein n=1 Tax=Photobacterium sp. Hal280 TaxID=3035163 RepID=UPI00301D88D7